MPPTLTNQEILDLAATTLKELGRLRFNQIAVDLQNYEVMGRIMKKDRVQFDDGTSIQRNLMLNHSGNARMVGLHETDRYNIRDVMGSIDIPWRHTTAFYAWERREMLINRGASRIVDLLQVRRIDMMLALAELMEEQFWSKPSASTDKLNVFGTAYWIVKNNTEGFNGGNPSGFSAGPGGLDHARFKNYTAQYANVNKDDLIKKMRTAHRKTKFKSPIDIPSYRTGAGQTHRIYMNEETLNEFELVAESQNDSLGRDVASMDGNATFKRSPLIWVPKLDDDTDDPVYMLDMESFFPVFLKGDYMRESEPEKMPNQHNSFKVDIDLTWQVMCDDRRRNTVIAKNTTGGI